MTFTAGVTGAGGFVGQYVVRRLTQRADARVVVCPREAWNSPTRLAAFLAPCDVIVHLAGLNRGSEDEVYRRNVELVERLVAAVERAPRSPGIVFASSTQRSRHNAYGRSKRRGEDLIEAWSARGGNAIAMEIPNVFGPGCRPHYNSVVATFCDQLARGESPRIVSDAEIEFVWVGDLAAAIDAEVGELAAGRSRGYRLRRVPGRQPLLVSELLAKLRGFLDSEDERGIVPDLTDPFDAQLYATLRSYLPLAAHVKRPSLHADPRGELCEVIKLAGAGQVFFSTTRPGVTRGNHYHTRKSEWFCVLQGEAVIRLRRIGSDVVEEIRVRGDSPTFVSIPVLHAHHIENTGPDDLLTMFWTNEIFDPADPDTFAEAVLAAPQKQATAA
ncbi:MAG: NAD-dependent epimerase/dehydratase family protein [Pirellulales bacterium]|nr:NAD-dependent epimerase/dehydratase family protein [Pirellulales bacterium]